MKQFITDILDTKLKQFRRNCPQDITDLVFLEIEKSHMPFYELAVKNKDKDTINKFIGKTVREHWNLKNLGRENHPQSRLIDSYEKHSN